MTEANFGFKANQTTGHQRAEITKSILRAAASGMSIGGNLVPNLGWNEAILTLARGRALDGRVDQEVDRQELEAATLREAGRICQILCSEETKPAAESVPIYSIPRQATVHELQVGGIVTTQLAETA